MLDLETLGSTPGSVILSIGAVVFGGGKIQHKFHTSIEAQSCVDMGLKMDVSTALWWVSQKEDARLALLQGQKDANHLNAELMEFAEWLSKLCPDFTERRIWGNGASFDCAVLAAAYRACDLPLPWKYTGERCYRTVKALYPDVHEEVRQGIHHDALADAEHQALHLMKLLPNL